MTAAYADVELCLWCCGSVTILQFGQKLCRIDSLQTVHVLHLSYFCMSLPHFLQYSALMYHRIMRNVVFLNSYKSKITDVTQARFQWENSVHAAL